MTVINMMSFGDSGAAIADEQASGGIRKSNVADKLHLINKVIVGGSGNVDVLNGVHQIVESERKGEPGVQELAYLFSQAATLFANSYKDSVARTQYGLTLDETLTGKRKDVPLDADVKKDITQMLRHLQDDLNSNSVLLGGMKNNIFQIYLSRFGQGSSTEISWIPYFSIGSGRDEADKILMRYVEQKPRKERKKIGRVEGMLKLIEATNAASITNIGVGGVPQIMYADAKGVREIDEEKCVLATEVVKGLTYEQLSQDFVHEAISSIVFDDPATSFEDMHEQMKSKAKSWEKLDRLLRGYKV